MVGSSRRSVDAADATALPVGRPRSPFLLPPATEFLLQSNNINEKLKMSGLWCSLEFALHLWECYNIEIIRNQWWNWNGLRLPGCLRRGWGKDSEILLAHWWIVDKYESTLKTTKSERHLVIQAPYDVSCIRNCDDLNSQPISISSGKSLKQSLCCGLIQPNILWSPLPFFDIICCKSASCLL